MRYKYVGQIQSVQHPLDPFSEVQKGETVEMPEGIALNSTVWQVVGAKSGKRTKPAGDQE